ncbi:type I-E CRISPR-associated protein Cas5/CasD [Telmatospirillum sp.]|uniref:type I-E CRISPR-associated protein Cas5/CasD n=1 Tax=Telmatospirillum sp. TaxID=2079197 RepID=UPI00283EB059|nr:type I-E CRISPR-associated protein Cas5/CasD [Telmatospirillum sp.]MDR3439159.1 type I-E CRISPR-associated protein Cas5/CasD [Telmatospirillum sp.]
MTARDFLVFRLAGPMTAFGDIAVGERRSLWDAPSKSGVLGLIGACLGLTRDDAAAHVELDRQLGFAVRVDRAGRPLRDYHTAMAPTEAARSRRQRQGRPLSTRKDDLECDDLNTVLSERLYRVEAAVTVALWQRPNHHRDLDGLRTALIRPTFVPYLGRKACPLGAPPQPKIIMAPSLLAAFTRYDAELAESDLLFRKTVRPMLRPPAAFGDSPVWFEWDAGLAAEEEMAEPVRLRRDSVRNRRLWQFADRQEGRLIWQPSVVGLSEEGVP